MGLYKPLEPAEQPPSSDLNLVWKCPLDGQFMSVRTADEHAECYAWVADEDLRREYWASV